MHVLVNQWRRHVHDVCRDESEELRCLGFQQDLPVYLHLTVHLRGPQFVHWYHQRYVREDKGRNDCVSFTRCCVVYLKHGEGGYETKTGSLVDNTSVMRVISRTKRCL